MLTLRFDTKALGNEINDLIDKIQDKSAIHRIIGVTLYDQTVERFEKEEGPDGAKWAPLTPLTLSNRRNVNGILRDSGELFRSIHHTSDASKAEVGTNLNHPKVWVMQNGATIKARRVPFLKIPVGGGGFTYAKQVTIPARPYIGIGKGDEEMVREAMEGYLEG